MPTSRRTNILICLTFICIGEAALRVPTTACAVDEIAVCPNLQAALLDDARDQKLDHHTLLSAALIAGGVQTEEDLAKYQAIFSKRFDGLKLQQHDATSATIEKVFATLHRDLFTGKYRLECSNVAETLATGDYNCLSGTILIMEAGRRKGLEIVAVAADNHVLCRLNEAPDSYVESTCPRWFELTSAQQKIHDPTEGQNHFDGHKPHNLRDMTDTQLIAKVYYNRGVALLREAQYERGVRLTRIAVTLDSEDNVAMGNLLAGMNNWALQLATQNKFSAAMKKLDELQEIEPGYRTIRENRWHICRRWAKSLCEDNRFDDALAVLHEGKQVAPSPEAFQASIDLVENLSNDHAAETVASAKPNSRLTTDGS